MYLIVNYFIIILMILCGSVLAVLLAGIWIGYKAQKTAKMMKSHRLINNNRCVAKVSTLAEPEGSFRFAVFGDIQQVTEKLPQLLSALKEENPVSFIVQTGDLVSHSDSGHYNLLMNELARSGLRVPLFVVPGNHDISRDQSNLFEHYFGSKQFCFQYGKALFVGLDNASNKLSHEQLDWLQNVLASRREVVQHIFLFMHKPPIYWKGAKRKFIVDMNMHLLRLIKNYGVNYVFSGHWHGYYRKEVDRTIFIINGEDAVNRHGNGYNDSYYYTLLEVGEHNISERRMKLTPTYGMFIRSKLKDWFVAHIGCNIWKLFLFGTLCIFSTLFR